MLSLRPLQWRRCFVSGKRINLVRVSLLSIKVFDIMSNNIERCNNVPVTNTLCTSGHNVFVTNSALASSTSTNPCGVRSAATTSVVGPTISLSHGCIGMIRVTPLPKYPAELVSLETSDTDKSLQIASNRRPGRKAAPSTRTFQDLNIQSEAGHFFSHYFPKVKSVLEVSNTCVPTVETIDMADLPETDVSTVEPRDMTDLPESISSELAISDVGSALDTESKPKLDESSRKRMISSSIIKVSGPPPKHAKRIDDINQRRPLDKLTLSLAKCDDKMDGTDVTDQAGNKLFDTEVEGSFDLQLPLSGVGTKAELESSNFSQMSKLHAAGVTQLALRDTRRYLDHESSLSAGVTEVSQSDDDSGISCFPDQSLSEITSPESPTDIVVLNQQPSIYIPASESPATILNKHSCPKIRSSERSPIVVLNEQSSTEFSLENVFVDRNEQSSTEVRSSESPFVVPIALSSTELRVKQSFAKMPLSESPVVVRNKESSEVPQSESPIVGLNEPSSMALSSSGSPFIVPIGVSSTESPPSESLFVDLNEPSSVEVPSSETATDIVVFDELSSMEVPSSKLLTDISILNEQSTAEIPSLENARYVSISNLCSSLDIQSAQSPTRIIACNKQSLSEMSVNPANVIVVEERSSVPSSSETPTNIEQLLPTKTSTECPTNTVDVGEPVHVVPNVTAHDTESKLSSFNQQQEDCLLSSKTSVLPKELLSSVTQFVKGQKNNFGFSGETLPVSRTSASSPGCLGNGDILQHPNLFGDDKRKSNDSLSQVPLLRQSYVSDSNHSNHSLSQTSSDSVTGLPFMDVTDIETSSPERQLDKAVSAIAEKPDRRAKKKAAKRKRNVEGGNENSEEVKKRSKPKAVRPNYFVAVQVTNPKIHGDLRKVQSDVIENKRLLQDAAIPLPTLHLTLMVMHLATEDDIIKAKGALNDCEQKLNDLKEKPLCLAVTGLGNFKNNVVFAKVQEGAALNHMYQIADTVSACFTEHGVLSADKKGFKPHITIFKLSRAPRLRKKGVKIIDPGFYQDHVDAVFGQQTVESLQLCSMLKPKDENGYYSVLHTVPLVTSDWRSMDYEESVKNMSLNCQENVNTDFDSISTPSEDLKTPDPNTSEKITSPCQDGVSSGMDSNSRRSEELKTRVSNSPEKNNATEQENTSSDVGSISRHSGELKASSSDISSISNLRQDVKTSASAEKLNPEDRYDVFSVKLEKELTWSFTKGNRPIEEDRERNQVKDQDGKPALMFSLC